jgi:hypothetical protein
MGKPGARTMKKTVIRNVIPMQVSKSREETGGKTNHGARGFGHPPFKKKIGTVVSCWFCCLFDSPSATFPCPIESVVVHTGGRVSADTKENEILHHLLTMQTPTSKRCKLQKRTPSKRLCRRRIGVAVVSRCMQVVKQWELKTIISDVCMQDSMYVASSCLLQVRPKNSQAVPTVRDA